MIEAPGEVAINKVVALANKIYESGEISEMIKKTEFIVISRKEGAIECKKHRTISIMSQVAKIVLKLVGLRLKRKVEQYVDEEQYGFRKKVKVLETQHLC